MLQMIKNILKEHGLKIGGAFLTVTVAVLSLLEGRVKDKQNREMIEVMAREIIEEELAKLNQN